MFTKLKTFIYIYIYIYLLCGNGIYILVMNGIYRGACTILFIIFHLKFSHKYIYLLRKHETLQDAFIHSYSGPPNTCLRQFCERVGAPAVLTLHKTHEGDYPCQRNQEISVSHSLAALIHYHIFFFYFFFLIFSYFFLHSHICVLGDPLTC